MQKIDHMRSVVEQAFVVVTDDRSQLPPTTLLNRVSEIRDRRIPASGVIHGKRYVQFTALSDEVLRLQRRMGNRLLAENQSRLETRGNLEIMRMALGWGADADYVKSLRRTRH